MGQAIGDILPLALAVAISPIPIIAVVLTLGTPRARSNGIAFTVGWVAGLTIVGTIVLLASSGNATQSSGAPATWTSVLKLGLGALFLALAVRAWRGRPRPGEEAEMPRWMARIDTFTGGKMLGLGALLSGLNPKNLALTVAAASTIAQTDIPGGREATALAVFILIGSLTIVAPVVIYFAMGTKAKAILDELRVFMAAHNGAIMTVLLLVLGAKLIGEAISGLST
jgi:threonine/homoserine/homoserine lactone efflux protein